MIEVVIKGPCQRQEEVSHALDSAPLTNLQIHKHINRISNSTHYTYPISEPRCDTDIDSDTTQIYFDEDTSNKTHLDSDETHIDSDETHLDSDETHH